jgi:hypothetical protein
MSRKKVFWMPVQRQKELPVLRAPLIEASRPTARDAYPELPEPASSRAD